MRISTGAYWWRGCMGEVNQDSLTLQHATVQGSDVLLAAVCDGIGSLTASEQAGAIAVRQLTKWFTANLLGLLATGKRCEKELILLALQRQVYHIQELLLKFQQKHKLITGTTLSCLLICKGYYFVVHIGDSRIYTWKKRWYLRQPKLRRITMDDEDEKGRLTACLGVECRDPAFYDIGKVKKGTVFMLCTDGFYKGMKDTLVGRMLDPSLSYTQGEIERRLELLAGHALTCGSQDNMSAICAFVQ